MTGRWRTVMLAISALALGTSGANSQNLEAIRIAPIHTPIECRLFESWWGWWMVIECRTNFTAIATRISAAIAETGTVTVASRDARPSGLEIRGMVTELGVTNSGFSTRDSTQSVSSAVGRLDVALVDTRSDRVLVARTVAATTEISAIAATDRGADANSMGSRAAYDLIQRKLALGAARMVAFYRRPLQVRAVDGGDITLNHGGAMMPLGSLVMVQPASGRPVRYRIISSGGTGAVAELDGSPGNVAAGQPAEFIEETDDQNNGRRLRRTELPEF